MAEIHHLPNRLRQSDPDADARRQKAQSVRKLIEDRPGSLPGSRDHADFAGRELFRIFKDADADFKRRVCEVAFGTRARVPTKRLWGVLIDPDKPREQLPLPAAKRKRLTIYLRLAEAIASISGQEEADVVLRVFPGISPDAEVASAQREVGLSEQLRDELWDSWLRANEMIIQDCDLRRALAVGMEYPLAGAGPCRRFRLDFNQVLGREDSEERLRARHRANYAMSQAPWDFVFGVAPSLFLGECHGPTFRATVAALKQDCQVAAPIPELGCWGRIWLRFWWSILPIGAQGDPRGCFLVSTTTERAPGALPVAELDENGLFQEERPNEVPWAALLSSAGARYEGHWTDRDLWEQRNAAGLVLTWDIPEGYSLTTGSFEGPFRCSAQLDPASSKVLRAVFGCEAEALPTDPVRILPPTASWRDVILGLPDAALADWVGPDPDEPGVPLPREARLPAGASDHERQAAEEAYDDKLAAWRDDEIEYQLRWLIKHHDGSQAARGFAPRRSGTTESPTIGSKFEESLLEVPEGERPDMVLRRQAEGLRRHAAKVTGSAAASRRMKLSALGRPSSKN